MPKRTVILELAHSGRLENLASAAALDPTVGLESASAPKLATCAMDESFSPVALPALVKPKDPAFSLYDTAAPLEMNMEPGASTYLVRGEVEETDLEKFEQEAKASRAVLSVFSDIGVETAAVCPAGPVGSHTDVENLLCVSRMRSNGMTGRGVLVAVVDSGVNLAHLNARGKTPVFDAPRSWSWNPATVTPGSAAVGHGTMCAFDVCIAAPECTLLDIALLRPLAAPPGGTLMSAMLSDAIRAYRHLLDVMTAPRRPGDYRSLVVNNSWGMFHPSWDFPVGHAGNYSENPNHPFTRIVSTLARAGADILFAAGNCGPECPDGRCQGVTTRPIYGANSSDDVTCVAGVTINKVRLGYSSMGPGRLTDRKPDLSGFTHFVGSGVYAADGGTSAATPVVSGVVAATRNKRPFNAADSATSPAAIRNLLTSTAEDLGAAGYDYQHGHGVVAGCTIVDRLVPRPPFVDICRRYPWICRPPFNICRRYPHLCRQIPIPRIPPVPPIGPGLDDEDEPGEEVAFEGFDASASPEDAAFLMGFLLGSGASTEAPAKHGCKCKGKEGALASG